MIIKDIIKRALQMSPPARSILLGGLRISCTLAACSLIIFVAIGGLSEDTYTLYKHAELMMHMPFVILFETIFGSAIAEDYAVN